MVTILPVLYSFRRCPYAIRARMALLHAEVSVELREVLLRERPVSMMEASPKGTVPVLVLTDGSVLEESLDIMLWCLSDSMLIGDWALLVEVNDGEFKENLDRYKYSDRFDDVVSMEHHRSHVLSLLQGYEERLDEGFLCGDSLSLADFALVPFVRQFANTDRKWFDGQDIPNVKRWMGDILEGELFRSSMVKHKQWQPDDDLVLFP